MLRLLLLAPFAASTLAAEGRFQVAEPALRTDRYAELARDYGRDDPLRRIAKELDAGGAFGLPVDSRIRSRVVRHGARIAYSRQRTS